jgi:DNA-binding HxlR family transcriptional regulator
MFGDRCSSQARATDIGVASTRAATVSYELTDLGLSLHQLMRGLKTWAELHMDDVLANRATHDTGTPEGV